MAIIKYKDKDGNLVPLGASGDHTHSPEAIGAAKKDHMHDIASIEQDGFMSSVDKVAITDLNDTIFGNDEKNIAGLVDLVGEGVVSERIAAAVANKVDQVGSKVLSTNDYTDADKTKLEGIAEGAEVNQNAFSNVVIGDSTIAADDKTDSITLATGDNITLTPDIADGKVTISATDTTYSEVTNETPGLMSVDDKKKLDGIATGATKVMVDDSLSDTSSNAVQNNVVTKAIDNLIATVGEGSVAERINAAKNDCITGLSASGRTITYTLGSGDTGTITTQDTDTTNLTITANAEDDDVVVLTGTNGTNQVSYKATHAKKGPSSQYTSGNTTTNISGFGGTGTIKVPQITVDTYGHVTAAADENVTITIPSAPTVDSSLSSTSTNAVQNKAVNTAIQNLKDLVGEIPVEELMATKQNTIKGAATTITDSNLTTNRALVSNGSGKVAVSAVTSTELGYLDGVTSNIQDQLNAIDKNAGMTTSTEVKNNTMMALVASDMGGGACKTYTNDYVYIGSNNCLYSNDQKVSVEGHTHSGYATSGHSHTASEIGAASMATYFQADFNAMTRPGFYAMFNCSSNAPDGSASYALIVSNAYDSSYVQQLAITEGTWDIYLRYYNSNGWSAWKRLALAEEAGGSSMIQSGSTSAPFTAAQTGSSWAIKTITFPQSYTTKPAVTISFTGDDVQYLSDVQVDIYNGYFDVLCHNSSSSTTTVTVNWIAVGS